MHPSYLGGLYHVFQRPPFLIANHSYFLFVSFTNYAVAVGVASFIPVEFWRLGVAVVATVVEAGLSSVVVDGVGTGVFAVLVVDGAASEEGVSVPAVLPLQRW